MEPEVKLSELRRQRQRAAATLASIPATAATIRSGFVAIIDEIDAEIAAIYFDVELNAQNTPFNADC